MNVHREQHLEDSERTKTKSWTCQLTKDTIRYDVAFSDMIIAAALKQATAKSTTRQKTNKPFKKPTYSVRNC